MQLPSEKQEVLNGLELISHNAAYYFQESNWLKILNKWTTFSFISSFLESALILPYYIHILPTKFTHSEHFLCPFPPIGVLWFCFEWLYQNSKLTMIFKYFCIVFQNTEAGEVSTHILWMRNRLCFNQCSWYNLEDFYLNLLQNLQQL